MRIYHREPCFNSHTGIEITGGRKVFSHHICDYCGAKITSLKPLEYSFDHFAPRVRNTHEDDFEEEFGVPLPILMESPYVFCSQQNCAGDEGFSFCQLKMATEMASASPHNDHWFVNIESMAEAWRASRIRVLTEGLHAGELALDDLTARSDGLFCDVVEPGQESDFD